MVFGYDCCKAGLLLLVGWCGRFCDVLGSDALAGMLFLRLFCLRSRTSVHAVLDFDQLFITLVWLIVFGYIARRF